MSKLKHVIESQQFTQPLLTELFQRSRGMERVMVNGGTLEYQNKILASLFYEPSTRTRFSFEAAMYRLGGKVLSTEQAGVFSSEIAGEQVEDYDSHHRELLGRDRSAPSTGWRGATGRTSFHRTDHQCRRRRRWTANLGKRESLHDVAKNLERMVQAIMIRTYAHEIVEKMAEYASIPIINGLTDYSHPCQAMADYLTMLEIKGHVSGLKIAYIGDGNNVCHSLLFNGAQLGAHVWAATPPGYEPKPDAVQWAIERGQQTGASCTVTHDPVEAVTDADVIYTDVWASMGQESEAGCAAQDFQSVSGELSLVAPCQVRRNLHALSPSASWPRSYGRSD